MRHLALLSANALLALTLAACGGGSSTTLNGNLTLHDGSELRIVTGVAHAFDLRLNGSQDVSALPVSVTVSDPRMASVFPQTCYLSSNPEHQSCMLLLRGKQSGSVTITASAAGYPSVQQRLTINEDAARVKTQTLHARPRNTSSTPNYGKLQIGAFPSASAPSSSNFNMTAMAGQTITLAASITDFDTPLNGVPILLTVDGTSGASIASNPQCNVDSNYDAKHFCLYTIKLPPNIPTSGSPPQPVPVIVTAQAVGGNATDFSNQPTATITLQTAPVPGKVVIQGTGSGVVQGMSNPFWVVLQDSSGVTTPITVTPSVSKNLQLNPAFPSGNTFTCQLSSANPVCGFGVMGTSISATETISASATGYKVNDLPVSVVAPASTSRSISFQNNDKDTVWLGITGGTATSMITAQMVASHRWADVDPKVSSDNTVCGPNNPAVACPTGATCRQGGANPDSSTTYYCYWDQPVPSQGYALAAHTQAQASTSISISSSSYDPLSDITWSGNFYPRQGCALNASGILQCAIADCGSSENSQGCAPGTGGAPGIATLAEITLQASSNDYYDISIIGGANVITSFGPDPASTPPGADGYMCGIAGSSTVQGTLLAADWAMAKHVLSNPTTTASSPYSTSIQTGSTPSTAYYHYIQSPSSGRVGAQCVTQPNPNAYCATQIGNDAAVCGYDVKAVNNGNTSDYVTSCGSHLAWLSANAIFALNASAKNAAPFPFATTYTTTAAGTVQLSSLYLCNNTTGKSGYSAEDASTACGCTNWSDSSLSAIGGDAAFNKTIATPSTACTTNNQAHGTYYWASYVLPTITWLKQACPTCYTYPFDDMSSTFQCGNATQGSSNSVTYLVQFNGTIAGR